MEIAILPNWLVKLLADDYLKQNSFNILLTNVLLLLFFLLFKNSLLEVLSYLPHFCLIDKLFTVECPVCGTTRAFCELSNGRVNEAYQLNPTSLLVALYFLIQIPLRLVSLLRNETMVFINNFSKITGNILLILIVLNWIITLLTN
jgi:hypothetical protein